MQKGFLILLFVMAMLSLTAQKQGKELADSLISVLPKFTNDSAKARALNRISLFYANINTDTALKYAAQGLQLVKKMKWQRGLGTFYTCFGNAYSTKGMYDSASYFYIKCLDINKEMKDSANMASSYNNIGSVFFSTGDYVKAMDNFILCLKLGEGINSNYYTGMAAENIGNTYYYQQNYNEALQWAKKSLVYRLADDDAEFIPSSNLLVGMAYRETKQYDSAIKYLQLSLQQEQVNGNAAREATALTNLAQVFANNSDYKKALLFTQKAQVIWNKVDPNYESALENTGLMGYCHLMFAKNKNISTAEKNAQLLLAKKHLTAAVEQCMKQNNRTIYSEYLQPLAEVSMLIGDYKNAYLFYKQYNEVQDSIFSQENKNSIAQAVSQLEIDKKNSEIQLQQLLIKNQQRQKWFFISGILALAIIGGLLFYQNKTRKKTNTILLHLNTELDEANKVKARFFAILGHDLRTPVANLVNFLHLQKNAADLLPPEKAAEQNKRITESAENLLTTMEDMLLWSKHQMTQFKPQIQPVPVLQLFDYIKNFFSSAQNIRFVFEQAPNLQVYTDENYLKTIMQNLTANAVKAVANTANASITWKAWAEGNKIMLSVTDNGPGITAETANSLFSDQALPNTKTGFGMQIIKDLARAVGCSISLKQQAETGCTFVLATATA